MPLNFPSNPTINQIYTYGTQNWKYDGSAWSLLSSSSSGGGTIVETSYTINNIGPDETGNFIVSQESLNSAPLVHQHTTNDITDLSTQLNLKSNSSHSHPYVQNIVAGGNTYTGSINIQTKGDLSATVTGQVLTLTAELPTVNSATNIVTNQGNVQTFMGTQAQWDAFTKTAGITYLAYIHE